MFYYKKFVFLNNFKAVFSHFNKCICNNNVCLSPSFKVYLYTTVKNNEIKIVPRTQYLIPICLLAICYSFDLTYCITAFCNRQYTCSYENEITIYYAHLHVIFFERIRKNYYKLEICAFKTPCCTLTREVFLLNCSNFLFLIMVQLC